MMSIAVILIYDVRLMSEYCLYDVRTKEIVFSVALSVINSKSRMLKSTLAKAEIQNDPLPLIDLMH